MLVKCDVCSFGFSETFAFHVLLGSLDCCLCLFIFFAIDCPECEAEYFQSLEFNQQYQGKLHLDHVSLPMFLLCNYFFAVGLHGRNWPHDYAFHPVVH